MNYIIETRYQYLNAQAEPVWTKWFPSDINHYEETAGNDRIKQMKEDVKELDKKTHLKHEYKLLSVEEYEQWLKELREKTERNRAELAKLPRMRKIWAKKNAKLKKELKGMDTYEKILRKAKENTKYMETDA